MTQREYMYGSAGSLCHDALHCATHTRTHCSNSKDRYVDLAPLSSRPSAEAFPLEHGRLRVGVGLRTSRSYELLTEAVKEEEKASEKAKVNASQATSLHSLPYGASPRYMYMYV